MELELYYVNITKAKNKISNKNNSLTNFIQTISICDISK